jgi:tRNA G10  N-methylase Trm11
MADFSVEERLDWRWWVTPRPLNGKPIHRWYVFPHSFTSELVDALITEWGLTPEDCILDPFVGAGTTLLAAKTKGIPADGYDLSPLSIFVSNIKSTVYDHKALVKAYSRLKELLDPSNWDGAAKEYPLLIKKALPGRLLGAFDYIWQQIGNIDCSNKERDFFRLSVIAILPQFSRAVASGGWLKWIRKSNTTLGIPKALRTKIDQMLEDVGDRNFERQTVCRAKIADARNLPVTNQKYSAVITSPPYPNRHDYTRVFGVELMFAFQTWEENRKLRYQSFHSHPEARPDRPQSSGYAQPSILEELLLKLRAKGNEPRIPAIVEGYFKDMYLCLKEVQRVSKPGARIAFVVGNAQYFGIPVPVDEITAEIAEQLGLKCEKLIVVRYRGNSAQQMGKFGRNPSRESVVALRRT